MNDLSRLEARIGRLISAYADQAPTDIDPVAMTRSVVTRSAAKGRLRFAVGRHDYGFVLGLLIVAGLVGVMVTGALTAGSHLFRRPLADAPQRPVVAPFIGLAPGLAEPSQPEHGTLVLSFEARITDLAMMHVRTWVFEDGRIVWTSEGGLHGRAPADAVVEQRLTSDGVALMRSLVTSGGYIVGAATTWETFPGAGGPGVLWGALTIAEDGQLFDVAWTDSTLPGRLADPLAWLPPSAWADPVIHGYVPSRYAVCAWADGKSNLPNGAPAIVALQQPVLSLVLDAGGPRLDPAGLDCYAVPLDTARSIAAALEAAGHRRDADYVGPRYDFRTQAGDQAITIDISPIVPSGEIVCNCG